MKRENDNKLSDLNKDREIKKNTGGYPLYPPTDDIYNKFHEEKNVNPEDISKEKEPNEVNEDRASDEKIINDELSGNDLDVPGSEMDDDQEKIGNEDEENNYYSLGGDDHNDLDE
jgi:hypothetical protein